MFKNYISKTMLLLLCLVAAIGTSAREVVYDFSKIDGFSSWGSSYSSHSVNYTDATVTFKSAAKQSQTINDIPVTKGSDVTLVMNDEQELTGVTFVCRQWTTKAQTITLHYSTDGGKNYTSTGVTSSNFTISKENLPAGTNAVKITFSSSSNQVGIASATIQIKDVEVDTPTDPTFSLEDGAYVYGTEIEITAGIGDEIFYTINNGDEIEYTEPIVLTEDMEIAAYSTKNGEMSEVVEAHYTIKEAQTFLKIQNAASLAAGDKIVIVNEAGGMALGTEQNTNNRTATAVTITSGKIEDISNQVQVLTLEGSSAGWYFNTGDGYLYAASSGSNYLRTEEEKDDNAKATITITSGNADITFQGTNTRNKLQGNGGIFSCYTGGQTAVQIYRLADKDDVDVAMGAYGFSTMYYSYKNLTLPTGMTAYTINEDEGKLKVGKTYNSGDIVPAGEAVVLKANEGNYTLTYSMAGNTKDANNLLCGTDEDLTTTGGTYYYKLTLNATKDAESIGFYYGADGGAAFTNKAHKAYLALSTAAARGFSLLSLFDDETTAIQSVALPTQQQSEVYDLQGRRLTNGNLQKGLYIVNGKKFINK